MRRQSPFIPLFPFRYLINGDYWCNDWAADEYTPNDLGEDSCVVITPKMEIRTERIMQRIWDHDHTVWKPEPDEISNQPGWLHSVEMMQANCTRLQALTDSILTDGYTDALLLDGDTTYDAALDALSQAGHPVARLHLQDVYDLGGQFFLWEMATAVAAAIQQGII